VNDFFRLKIVSKRQVTIPHLMLEKLHLREGDELEVEIDDGVIVAVKPLKLVPTDFFSDHMLHKLEERSRSMDAGRKATEPQAAVVRKGGSMEFGDKIKAEAQDSFERAAEQEQRLRSAGGD
jgi:AbrB family looped-hinge helix DNA binding protein